MSKEKLLLVGAGGFGRMVAEQASRQYDCAFVDDGQVVGAEVCGIPVVGGIADLPELRKEYAKIGYGCVVLQNACIQNGSQVGNGVFCTPVVLAARTVWKRAASNLTLVSGSMSRWASTTITSCK